MIKRTKHGRIALGSTHSELPCEDCNESTLEEEAILVFYPKAVHATRRHTKCFLEENPRHKIRYEIVMATLAINGISEPSFQESCNLCGFSTRGEDVLVCFTQGDVRSRKFYGHLACFMGIDRVRSVPDVHISTTPERAFLTLFRKPK